MNKKEILELLLEVMRGSTVTNYDNSSNDYFDPYLFNMIISEKLEELLNEDKECRRFV